ncbi:hypothetical protein [Aquimarina sp. LLG6339-5]|uniref:hypothetical protein n=1 Tax=Aquimarina sp. LLG6339-5 TaxID=3160830 RepID=UPI00386E08E3
MKKITLLLVAAVFAIGIQSCSTEEEVFIEESALIKKANTIPENAIHFGAKSFNKGPEPPKYKRIFVRYLVGTSYQYRLNFTNTQGPQIFDDFYVVMNNGCDYVDEWYVRCDTCGGIGTEGEKTTVVNNNNLSSEDGEDTSNDDLIDNSDLYQSCFDVPVISLLINNNQNPCGICN